MRNSEKCPQLDAGFIWVKPDSVLIYTCHLFDVRSTTVPTLLGILLNSDSPESGEKGRAAHRENANRISKTEIICNIF